MPPGALPKGATAGVRETDCDWRDVRRSSERGRARARGESARDTEPVDWLVLLTGVPELCCFTEPDAAAAVEKMLDYIALDL